MKHGFWKMKDMYFYLIVLFLQFILPFAFDFMDKMAFSLVSNVSFRCILSNVLSSLKLDVF